MEISRRTLFATKTLCELAQQEDGIGSDPQEFAAQREVSPGYSTHLLNALHEAGLVRRDYGKSLRYRLAKRPTEITLRQVFDVFEGLESPTACARPPHPCRRSAACVVNRAWCDCIEECVVAMERTTIADLTRRAGPLRERQVLNSSVSAAG